MSAQEGNDHAILPTLRGGDPRARPVRPVSRTIVAPEDRLVMVVGAFGSGKTEAAVNLALLLAEEGRRVQIADLDLVNPYFRCREARDLMRSRGISVIVPPGEQMWADLPILLPQVRGLLHPPGGMISLFDVGGDDVGSRVLSTFRCELREGDYQLWQVINARRPFSDTPEGCLRMMESIESASRLRMTGLLVNTHLIDETTPGIVLEGWRMAREVSRRSGLPVRCVAVRDHLADDPVLREIDAPLLRLERRMLPPWIPKQGGLNG